MRSLGVRHRLSTPYYPQSNGKVERVIGTLKSMLKRTVAAAAAAQIADCVGDDMNVVAGSGGIKVFGVGLELDNTIMEAITAAGEERRARASDGAEVVDDIPVLDSVVHWSSLLHTVLWVYRASPHNATGLSPALLALGRELRLPMDIPPHVPGSDFPIVAPMTDEEHRAIIARRLHWISDRIEGLGELRHGRRDSSNVYKAQFQLGQKVWKRDPV